MTGLPMTDEDAAEIKALLKEIRDWQQATSEPLLVSVRRGLRRPFRFNLSAALLTTTWVAIWFATISFNEPSEPLIHLWLFFLITPPAAAVGAFLNHPLLALSAAPPAASPSPSGPPSSTDE
jgi:hypothetical protein